MTPQAPEPDERLADPPETTGTADSASSGVDRGSRAERDSRGTPGWIVVTIATLIVIATAVAEALVEETIGTWTGIALVATAVIAPLVTRAGDRSLPAMMPPLAFIAAVLTAGQALVEPEGGSWQTREALMIGEVLGANAAWVVAATALSTTIAAVRHVADRRRARRRP